jgi:hypothetical protein
MLAADPDAAVGRGRIDQQDIDGLRWASGRVLDENSSSVGKVGSRKRSRLPGTPVSGRWVGGSLSRH